MLIKQPVESKHMSKCNLSVVKIPSLQCVYESLKLSFLLLWLPLMSSFLRSHLLLNFQY